MTYLELCRRVARESGVIPGGSSIQTVTGQTGRIADVIAWTSDAYVEIQRERADWSWLLADFNGKILTATREYDGMALGADRHSAWAVPDGGEVSEFTVYDPQLGRDDEGNLYFLPWLWFRQDCLTGGAVHELGKPTAFTVLPNRKLSLYPRPDKEYRMRGLYRKGPQVLAAADDVPEMPAEFHELIVWRALLLLAARDEAFEQNQIWGARASRIMSDLVLRETPPVEITATGIFE